MKRSLAVAVLSVVSLAGPQLAGAGQGAYYPSYNQNPYSNRYERQHCDRGWHDRGEYRDNSYRNGYYGDSGYYSSGYYGSGYDNRYGYDPNRHAGRSTAIIGGSAAAGAVFGAAAGGGRGAAIGALVGGVAGIVADQAVRHHDRRYGY